MNTGEVLTPRSLKELKTRPKNTKEFCKITTLIAASSADCVDSQKGHPHSTDSLILTNLDSRVGIGTPSGIRN